MMAVALRQSRRFDSTSPVTRYWIANCVGFSLSGRLPRWGHAAHAAVAEHAQEPAIGAVSAASQGEPTR